MRYVTMNQSGPQCHKVWMIVGQWKKVRTMRAKDRESLTIAPPDLASFPPTFICLGAEKSEEEPNGCNESRNNAWRGTDFLGPELNVHKRNCRCDDKQKQDCLPAPTN
jgi:hypothetical protein